MVGQAQTGSQRSIPKAANVKAADDKKVLFKNMGNNHSYPMMWADTLAMDGTSVVVASGIAFHGMDLATYANVTVSAVGAAPSAPLYVTKDTVNNVVAVESSASFTGSVDVQIMLGGTAAERYIDDYSCRANTGATKNF